MKLALAPLVLTLATALITGCGPGLTTRVHAPAAPTDVELAMDRELSHALIGTTSLTSASLPAPAARVAAASPAPESEVQPPVQTWGAEPDQDPNYNPEYGF